MDLISKWFCDSKPAILIKTEEKVVDKKCKYGN